LDKNKLKKDKLAISFINTLTHKEHEYTFLIDPTKTTPTESDISFKFIGREYLRALEMQQKQGESVSTQDIVDVSITYSILCQETSFFAKIKNKNKKKDVTKVSLFVKCYDNVWCRKKSGKYNLIKL
jgi:hypothetical protein